MIWKIASSVALLRLLVCAPVRVDLQLIDERGILSACMIEKVEILAITEGQVHEY